MAKNSVFESLRSDSGSETDEGKDCDDSDDSNDVWSESSAGRKYSRTNHIFSAVNKVTAKILAKGQHDEIDLLQDMYIQQQVKRHQEHHFIKNAKELLSKTKKSSEIHRSVKALLAKTMSNAVFLHHGLAGCRKGIERARLDFKSIIHNGKLKERKRKPSGKSFVNDFAIKNIIQVIVGKCPATAWSIRCHIIRPDKVTRNQSNLNHDEEDFEIIYLPAFHRKVSRAEMQVQLLSQFPNEKYRVEKTLFFQVAKWITRTEETSLRALDYNITDLLYEPHHHLK